MEVPRRPKIGVCRTLLTDDWGWPIHGLRHPPTETTSGWYIWCGDLSDEADFFQPLHQDHFAAQWPALAQLLELPPGSRFLVAPDHQDTWFDETLLNA